MYDKIIMSISKHLNLDAKYFLSGSFWVSVSQVITVSISFFSTIILANLLSTNDYGTYRYLLGLIGIFSAFSLTGLGAAILQAAAKKHGHFYHETLGVNFLYSLPISIVSMAGAIYYYANNNYTLTVGCILIAILQPIINTFGNLTSYLYGAQRFKQSVSVQFIKSFFVNLIIVSTVFFAKNVLVIILSSLLGNILVNYLTHYIYKPATYQPTPINDFKKYFSYTIHTSIRNSISLISSKIDAVLLFTNLGAKYLAIYSIAVLIPEHIKSLLRNVVTLVIPKYAQREDLTGTIRSIPKRCLQLLIPLILLTAAYILMVPYVYPIIFPAYHESILYTQILALSFPTAILFIPYNFIKVVISERVLYRITILSALFQTTLLITLIIFHGIIGAVIASTIYRYIFMIIVFFYYKQIVKSYLQQQHSSVLK